MLCNTALWANCRQNDAYHNTEVRKQELLSRIFDTVLKKQGRQLQITSLRVKRASRHERELWTLDPGSSIFISRCWLKTAPGVYDSSQFKPEKWHSEEEENPLSSSKGRQFLSCVKASHVLLFQYASVVISSKGFFKKVLIHFIKNES